MARFVVLFALCTLAAAATNSGRLFTIKGAVYIDNCMVGFETKATEYISHSYVQLQCKHRETNAITYTADAVTDDNGKYSIEVESGHDKEVCDVVLVNTTNPLAGKPDPGRDRSRVILTSNNGMTNDIRYANSLGFTTRKTLDNCEKIIAQYHLNDDDF